MKFSVKYTKLGNQFFFISNLAEWHFSCRPRYNKEWLKKIGKLNKKEKNALNKFKKILKKYNFSHYLGIPFITENDENVWPAVQKWVKPNEYKTIRNASDIFEEKFKKIWKPQILNNNIKSFKKELGRNCYKEIDKHLTFFWGKYDTDKIKNVNIFLIKHPLENRIINGGANLNGKGITIECNKLIYPKHISVEMAAAVLYHEFIHMAYQKILDKKVNIIISNNKKNKVPIIQNRSLKEITTELIITSLFPEGYLADKYLHYRPYKNIKSKIEEYETVFNLFKKGEKVNFYKLQYYIAYKLYPLAKEYIENKKRIDKRYIKEVLGYLKTKNG